MLNEILQKLNENSDAIVELLDYYECGKIKVNTREVRFARDDRPESGLNISIRLENNDACLVKDFARSEVNNIISWLCKEKNTDFKSVLLTVKRILNLSDDWRPPSKQYKLFAGIYDSIINKKPPMIKTYSDDILKNYVPIGNKLWLNDGISLETQREFNICFDVESNSIVIPWYNQFGEIIAIKNRINGIPEDGMSKYYYSLGGLVSSSLYGFSENYIYLQNTEILIGESEKQVLQLATKGYRNAVSLGSNSLSEQQAKLLLSLNPTKLIWLLDEGLPKENTLKNAQVVQEYCAMRQVEQYWWNWENSLTVPESTKMSPGDCSKNDFENILKYELEKLNIGDEKI